AESGEGESVGTSAEPAVDTGASAARAVQDPSAHDGARGEFDAQREVAEPTEFEPLFPASAADDAEVHTFRARDDAAAETAMADATPFEGAQTASEPAPESLPGEAVVTETIAE